MAHEGRVSPRARRADASIHLGGDVHPTLVQAELLARAEAREEAADALGAPAIRGEILAADEGHLRTQAPRLAGRHQLLEARGSGAVVGGDDEVLLGDRHGALRQARVTKLLHLAVETVGVEVHDDPAPGPRVLRGRGRMRGSAPRRTRTHVADGRRQGVRSAVLPRAEVLRETLVVENAPRGRSHGEPQGDERGTSCPAK